MWKQKNAWVDQVLVGLDRVGIAGLRAAVKKAADSGLTEREAVVDLILDALDAENYIPDRGDEAYRTAMWREYLRFKGEEIRDTFTGIEVTIRGGAGERRDALAGLLGSVLEEFELKPIVTLAAGGGDPEIEILGETIARGFLGRRELKEAVRKSISGW